MSLLSVTTFFKYFIYHPDSEHLITLREKIIVKVAHRCFSKISFKQLPRLCQYVWGHQIIWSQKEKQIILNRIRAAVNQTISPVPHRDHKMPQHCDKIYHGLFLGDKRAFLDVIQSNSNCFKTIMTACPLKPILKKISQTLKSQEISSKLKERRIEWFHVGSTSHDDARGWKPLIHDCTFPKSEMTTQGFNYFNEDAIEAINQIKKYRLKQIPTNMWFKTAFSTIDKAIFNEQPLLVHCYSGISRSSTVIAAYLINRCQVDSRKAIDFLKFRRNCVNPKFRIQLENYQSRI